MGLDGVSQWLLGEDQILVLSSHFLSLDEAGGFKVLDDSLDGAFGNSDPCSDFSQNQLRLSFNQDEHVGVVGQKRPAMRGAFRLRGGSKGLGRSWLGWSLSAACSRGVTLCRTLNRKFAAVFLSGTGFFWAGHQSLRESDVRQGGLGASRGH